MTHRVLVTLNGPFFVILMLLAVSAQTALFFIPEFDWFSALQPDFVLFAVLWVALRRDFTEGGILTLIFAHIAEIHSSVPRGILLTSSMAIYLGMRAFSKYLMIPDKNSLIALTMIASVIHRLAQLLMLHWLGAPTPVLHATVISLVAGSLVEGIFSMWVYRFFEKLDWITFKNPKSRNRLEDEFMIEEEGI